MTTDLYESPWQAALLLAPTAVVSLLFLYYPAVRSVHLSFHETLQFGSVRRWAGLQNYVSLATSGAVHRSVLVTLLFSLVVVAGVMTVSLIVAYLVYRVSLGRGVYVVATVWTYALPPAVAGIVVFYLVHPSLGALTAPIEAATGVDVDWFTDGTQAFVVVAAAAVWKQIGYNVVFVLAALNDVPASLGEVADLDGVGWADRLLRVYVPLVSPTLVFLAVVNTIYAFFGTFALVDILTKGGPAGATNVLIYDLYRNAFEYNDHGLASAQSVLLFLVVGGLTWLQLTVSDRYAHYG